LRNSQGGGIMQISIPMTNSPLPPQSQPEPVFDPDEKFWVDFHSDFPIPAMIDSGFYTWIDPHVLRFALPPDSQGEADLYICLLRFTAPISSEAALLVIDQKGYRSVRLDELLALASLHPHLQMRYPIVGLGSVTTVFHQRVVPCVTKRYDGGLLCLCSYEQTWSTDYRFAVLSKADYPQPDHATMEQCPVIPDSSESQEPVR